MHWVWIDRVLAIEHGRLITCIKNVSRAEDHLRDQFSPSGDAVMPATLIIEGMAQAAGILVCHLGGFRDRVVLAMVKRADLTHDVVPGFSLLYTAKIQHVTAVLVSTCGTVHRLDPVDPGGALLIGQIDLVFARLPQARTELEGPEVLFGEKTKRLLRTQSIIIDG